MCSVLLCHIEMVAHGVSVLHGKALNILLAVEHALSAVSAVETGIGSVGLHDSI